MELSALKRFAARSWSAAADSKRDYWTEAYRQQGPEAARRASTVLWQHARRLQPQFPADADRTRDFSDHVSLRQRLDLAARALTRR